LASALDRSTRRLSRLWSGMSPGRVGRCPRRTACRRLPGSLPRGTDARRPSRRSSGERIEETDGARPT
jgi:hypothetical protein